MKTSTMESITHEDGKAVRRFSDIAIGDYFRIEGDRRTFRKDRPDHATGTAWETMDGQSVMVYTDFTPDGNPCTLFL